MANPELFVDFETQAAVPIGCGLPNYFDDPWWEPISMSYVIVEEGEEPGEPKVVDLREDKTCPPEVAAHIDAGLPVWAHNVEFERRVFRNLHGDTHYGWPLVTIEQSHCTMALAYSANLPGSLEHAAEAVDIPQRKDKRGAALVKQVTVPKEITECLECFGGGCGSCRGTGFIPTYEPASEEEWHHLIHVYCPQDVLVCWNLSVRIPRMSARERKIWIVDQKVNERGIALDIPAINAAYEVCQEEERILVEEISQVTDGTVESVGANGRWVDFLKQHAPHLNAESIAKDKVKLYLEDEEISDQVRKALELRLEISKSSTKKLCGNTGLLVKQHRGRLFGGYQYHGAGTTGRWAGRGPQPQNLPRPDLPQSLIEELLDMLGEGRWDREFASLFGPPLHVISSCLRGMFVASPGMDLCSVDYSAIEARMLPWLAGEESTLDVFRSHGKIYEYTACRLFGLPSIDAVDSDQRLRGKVASLALGYGGGVGAGKSMGKNYGLYLGDAEWERLRDQWREANPNVVSWWYALQDAMLEAVSEPGTTQTVTRTYGSVKFKVSGSFLLCQMPSGKINFYPYPELMDRETPWGKIQTVVTYRTMATSQDNDLLIPTEPQIRNRQGRWARVHTYGGKIAENITQSEARTLMGEAMIRLDDAGYPIVMHTHDELTPEVPKGERHVERVAELMCELPAWAAGLPVEASGWQGRRYRK